MGDDVFTYQGVVREREREERDQSGEIMSADEDGGEKGGGGRRCLHCCFCRLVAWSDELAKEIFDEPVSESRETRITDRAQASSPLRRLA